ncbi:unnamed protein product [Cylicocyclus nassatus]|uniref:Uncharacterized protein n=1 Tax=Cylicocyclus nassatus TaxID=53992 RepID=A0AA36GN47_CYLNA|nr:unnamed protein product [Cylicocyclus nassatus]
MGTGNLSQKLAESLNQTFMELCKANISDFAYNWFQGRLPHTREASKYRYKGLCPCPCAKMCNGSADFSYVGKCKEINVSNSYFFTLAPETTTTTLGTTKTVTPVLDVARNCSKYRIHTPPVNMSDIKCFEFNSSWLDNLTDISTRNKALQFCDGDINCWTYNNLMKFVRLRKLFHAIWNDPRDLCPCSNMSKCRGQFSPKSCTPDFKLEIMLARDSVSRETFNITLPTECKENEPPSSELLEQTCYSFLKLDRYATPTANFSTFCPGSSINCWVYKDLMESIHLQKLANMTVPYQGLCLCKDISICKNSKSYFNETSCSQEYLLRIAEPLEKSGYTVFTEPPHNTTAQTTIDQVKNATTTTQKDFTYSRTETLTKAEISSVSSLSSKGMQTSTLTSSPRKESDSASLGTTVMTTSLSSKRIQTSTLVSSPGKESDSTFLKITVMTTSHSEASSASDGEAEQPTLIEYDIVNTKSIQPSFVTTGSDDESESSVVTPAPRTSVASKERTPTTSFVTTNSVQPSPATTLPTVGSESNEVTHTSRTLVVSEEEINTTFSCFRGPQTDDSKSIPTKQATASSMQSSGTSGTEKSSSNPLPTTSSDSTSLGAQNRSASDVPDINASSTFNHANLSTATFRVSEKGRDLTSAPTDSDTSKKARNTVVMAISDKASLGMTKGTDLISITTQLDDHNIYNNTAIISTTVGTSDELSNSYETSPEKLAKTKGMFAAETTTPVNTSSLSHSAVVGSSDAFAMTITSDSTNEDTLEASTVPAIQGEPSLELSSQPISEDAEPFTSNRHPTKYLTEPATTANGVGSSNHSTKDSTPHSTFVSLNLSEILGYPSVIQKVSTTDRKARFDFSFNAKEKSTSTQKISSKFRVTLSDILTTRNGHSTPMKPTSMYRKSPNTGHITLFKILTRSPIITPSSAGNLASQEITSYSESNPRFETSAKVRVDLSTNFESMASSAHSAIEEVYPSFSVSNPYEKKRSHTSPGARTDIGSVTSGKIPSGNTDKLESFSTSTSSLPKTGNTGKPNLILISDSSGTSSRRRTQSTTKKTTFAHLTSNENESYMHVQRALSSRNLPKATTSSPLKSSVYKTVSEVEAKDGGREYGTDAYIKSATSTSKTPFSSIKVAIPKVFRHLYLSMTAKQRSCQQSSLQHLKHP